MKISTLTERCAIHKQHKISIYVDIMDDQRDMVEGALNGFLNSWGCAECTAESVDMGLDLYVEMFVDKFLPEFLPAMERYDREGRLKWLRSINLLGYG